MALQIAQQALLGSIPANADHAQFRGLLNPSLDRVYHHHLPRWGSLVDQFGGRDLSGVAVAAQDHVAGELSLQAFHSEILDYPLHHELIGGAKKNKPDQ